MIGYRLATSEMMFAVPPFSYEFVKERPADCQWRIKDSRDDAYGSASTEEDAKAACNMLNGIDIKDPSK